MESTYLSVGEIAQILGKSLKWAYSRIHEIPGSFKIGGSWFVDRQIFFSSLKERASKSKGRVNRPAPTADRHGIL